MAVALAKVPAICVPHTFWSRAAAPIEGPGRPVMPPTCRSQ
jgi:hypothetical protein